MKWPASVSTELPPYVRDLRFQRDVDRLCKLGPRAVYQYLAEVGDARSIRTFLEDHISAYAAIEPDRLAVVGGDRFPPPPIHEVPK